MSQLNVIDTLVPNCLTPYRILNWLKTQVVKDSYSPGLSTPPTSSCKCQVRRAFAEVRRKGTGEHEQLDPMRWVERDPTTMVMPELRVSTS